MLVYHYHPSTGEFLGQGLADESPLEPGVFLIPANATSQEPPTLSPGFITVWTGSCWEEIEIIQAEPQPAQTVPQVVTPRQARLALLGAGLLSSVESAIAAMTGPEGDAARITWEFAEEIRRDFPLILQLAEQLEITNEQIDQLFITASTL